MMGCLGWLCSNEDEINKKMAEQTLKDKTVVGIGWSAADAFLGQGVTFLVGLVLARLLLPEEYGLIGIVTVFTTILLGFVDCGFSNSLIRKPEVSDDDYFTLFIVNMIMSVLMFLLLYISAPAIASFFARPQLVALLRVMGSILIFQALSIVQMTMLSRRIDFKTKTKASVISASLSGVIGIGMALKGYGVWSLVVQLLSRQLIYSICLWSLNKWWPKIRFNVESFCYMWDFGWKLMLSGLLERIWGQLNQMIIGKYYTPTSLGQFTRAREYSSIFSSNFSAIVQRVSFPVLSQLQGDKDRMVSVYRRVIKTTIFVSAVITISMGAVSEPLIYCMIGPQWHEAATYLPLICLTMSLYPIHAINLNMLQVQNRTDIYLYLEIIKKILGLAPLMVGLFISIYWMLIAEVIFSIVSFFLNTCYSGRSLGYSSWMQFKDMAPSYLIAFVVAFSVYFFKYLSLSYWIILPIQVIVGFLVFWVVNEIVKLEEYFEVKNIAVEYIRKLVNYNTLK